VLFYGAGYYLQNPGEILNFSHGGMSFHGGLVGAVVGGCIACRIQKINIPTMCDLAAIVTPIGLCLGRIANFINGELWGAPTDLPWGVVFSAGDVARHPTQLYEAFLEGVVIFVVLMLLARRTPPRPQGTFMGWFLVLYAVFRMAIELVRVPDEQLGYLFGPVTMGMLLSLPVLVVGVALLVWAHRTQRPQAGYVDRV
jgi:phosphatidylglycerol:prolipoprotein diacylglycerol transferase